MTTPDSPKFDVDAIKRAFIACVMVTPVLAMVGCGQKAPTPAEAKAQAELDAKAPLAAKLVTHCYVDAAILLKNPIIRDVDDIRDTSDIKDKKNEDRLRVVQHVFNQNDLSMLVKATAVKTNGKPLEPELCRGLEAVIRSYGTIKNKPQNPQLFAAQGFAALVRGNHPKELMQPGDTAFPKFNPQTTPNMRP